MAADPLMPIPYRKSSGTGDSRAAAAARVRCTGGGVEGRSVMPADDDDGTEGVGSGGRRAWRDVVGGWGRVGAALLLLVLLKVARRFLGEGPGLAAPPPLLRRCCAGRVPARIGMAEPGVPSARSPGAAVVARVLRCAMGARGGLIASRAAVVGSSEP